MVQQVEDNSSKASISNLNMAYDENSSSNSSSSDSDESQRNKKSSVKGISKPKSGRKVKITKEVLQDYYCYPQVEAAKLLGVSLSTLKRKFYELKIGRWPHYEARIKERKRSLTYILNANESNNPKRLDYRTLAVLNEAFADCTKPIRSYSLNESCI
ncbi:hypothetical protein AKO1_010898 [Acrasis kona]|uniref:RWP-RK domain-containing protein n=1 Tax=Acrasis kona TaxID=1008807 RepID=A0AAW2YH94_9EUKA